MKIKLFAFLFFYFAAALFALSEEAKTAGEKSKPVQSSEAVDSSKTLSEKIPVEKNLRIISLSPNITSIVSYLGYEDNLVGITRFCKANKKIEIVGDYLSPDFEKIISLKPDYIFLLQSQEEAKLKFGKFGLKTKQFGNDRIFEVADCIRIIGETLKCEEKSKALIDKIKAASAEEIHAHSKEEIKTSSPDENSGHKSNKIPSVIFIVGKQSENLSQIYAAAKGTFIDDMISAAGGRNIIEESKMKYPIISKETLLNINPDIILDASAGTNLSDKNKKQQIEAWEKLGALNAVKNNKVFIIDDAEITIPGAGIPESIRKLKEIFHSGEDKK